MKRFTADASHELRSPLANMQSTIEVTLSQPRDADDYRTALASLNEDVGRLRHIVADLLLLAQADGGRLPFQLEPIRLDVLAGEAVESFAERAAALGVRLTMSPSPEVVIQGDERWLRQLVVNLVENALRFSGTESGGASPAEVRVAVSADNGAVSPHRRRHGSGDSRGRPRSRLREVLPRRRRRGDSTPTAAPASGLRSAPGSSRSTAARSAQSAAPRAAPACSRRFPWRLSARHGAGSAAGD